MLIARHLLNLALVCLFTISSSSSFAIIPTPVLFGNEPKPSGNFLSPDGLRVLSIKDRNIAILNVTSNQWTSLPNVSEIHGSISNVSWGEDGNTLYVRLASGDLHRVPLNSTENSFKIEFPHLTSWFILTSGQDESPFLIVRAKDTHNSGTHIYQCFVGVKVKKITNCIKLQEDVNINSTVFMSTSGHISGLDYRSASGSYVFDIFKDDSIIRSPVSYDVNNLGRLVSPVNSDGLVWALSNKNRETVALVLTDMFTGDEEVYFQHPRYDIISVIIDKSEPAKPLAVLYEGEYQQIEFFDDRVRETFDFLRKKVGTPSRIKIISQDWNANRVTVEVISQKVARAVYLMDFGERNAFRIASSPMEQYAEELNLENPVTIPTRDKREIYGYFTLPKGHNGRDKFGTVLMIHGGPMERSVWSIGRPGQYLSDRHYGVLRLNYRGSEGYGREYKESGYGAKLKVMVNDIEDAVYWLESNGYTNKDEVMLMGGSFGGLLALMAMGRKSGMYAGGIVVNPLVDVLKFWEEEWEDPAQRNLWRRYLRSKDVPRREARAISPLEGYSKLKRPVLFLLGEEDRRISGAGARQLGVKLRKIGRTVELVSYKGVGHDIWRAGARSLAHLHETALKFLRKHLPIETQ